MSDPRDFYRDYNGQSAERIPDKLSRIEEIRAYLEENAGDNEQIFLFLTEVAELLLDFAELENELDDDFFTENDIEDLKEMNSAFFDELLPENYATSYANPSYCAEIFNTDDKPLGQLLSYYYLMNRQNITYSFLHKLRDMEELIDLFVDVFEYTKDGSLEFDNLKEIITSIERKDKTEEMAISYREAYDPSNRYYLDIVENIDLSDLRYLYRFGTYISDDEVKIAEFMNGYSEEKLRILARQMALAFKKGFVADGKDMSRMSTVMIRMSAGFERLIRYLIPELNEIGLNAMLPGVSGKQANKQYGYDHRFDNSLFLDEKYVENRVVQADAAGEKVKEHMAVCAGVIVLDKFGEEPFSPESKDDTLKLSKEQQELSKVLQHKMMMVYNKYYNRAEKSFSIIAFPSPEIGENFEEIFEDILEVNMLNSEEYEGYQKAIIDVLDTAVKVQIKGIEGNDTDLTVAMQTLKDREKHTNFVNCGADVNIPVGEVFTSPKLTGTNGMLHIKDTYLKGLRYKDLRIAFKDGYIEEYSCANFDDPEKSRKYVHENLLHPHDTLPLGEFAIGTNTLAYTMARKHKIMDVLPILIIEKMGPHFAVGDTCFTFEEDKPVFNPDNKEITARENERTALRKEDPQKAYTFTHTDITLPYESIAFIRALDSEGKGQDIIRDGRFVVEGTEDLNKPLDQ